MARGILREALPRHCVACGTEYTPRAKSQQYCSADCRPSTNTAYITVTPEQQRVLRDIVGKFAEA